MLPAIRFVVVGAVPYVAGLLCGTQIPRTGSGTKVPEKSWEPVVAQPTPVEAKPPGPETFATRFQRAKDGKDGYDVFADTLTIGELQTALEEVEPKQWAAASRQLLARWGELDGRAAFDYALSIEGTEDERKAAIRGAIIGWARVDAGAAEQAIAGTQDPFARDTATLALAQALARKEPEKAMQMVRNLPARDIHTVVGEIFTFLGRGDVRLGQRLVLSAPERIQSLTTFSSHWASLDPRAALAWTTSLANPEERKAATNTAIHSAMRLDPEYAANLYLSSYHTSSDHFSLCHNVTFHWIGHDWKRAYDWIRALPPAENKADVLSYSLDRFMEVDPSAFIEKLKTDPPGFGDGWLEGAVSTWVPKDPAACIEWVQKQNPAIAAEAWPVIVQVMANSDLDRALDLAAQLTGAAREKSYENVIHTWTKAKPTEAAAWVLRQPDGPAKQSCVRRLAMEWALNDKAAAAKWLAGLPAGAVKTAATEAAKPWLRN